MGTGHSPSELPQVKTKALTPTQAPRPDPTGQRMWRSTGPVWKPGMPEEHTPRAGHSVLGQARIRAWTQQRPSEGPAEQSSTVRGSGGQRYSQTHAGVGRKHVDVVLTQRVDDDGLAPVHQVSRELENLRAVGAGTALARASPATELGTASTQA